MSYHNLMEFYFHDSNESRLTFTATTCESHVIRSAIRKLMLESLISEGRALPREAAHSLIAYYDFTAAEESRSMPVECSLRHLEYFGEVLKLSLNDLSSEQHTLSTAVLDDIAGAAIEVEARKIGLTIPDFVPDNG